MAATEGMAAEAMTKPVIGLGDLRTGSGGRISAATSRMMSRWASRCWNNDGPQTNLCLPSIAAAATSERGPYTISMQSEGVQGVGIDQRFSLDNPKNC